MRRMELWESAPGFDPALGQDAPALNLFLLDDGQPHGMVVVFPAGATTSWRRMNVSRLPSG